MAAISVTAANVQQTAKADVRQGVALEAITAGQPVYRDSDGQIGVAESGDTEAKAAAIGVAVNDAAEGQYINYAVKDTALDIGGTVVAGESYAVGSSAGDIVPIDDLTTDDYIWPLGVGVSTSEIYLNPYATGAQHA